MFVSPFVTSVHALFYRHNFLSMPCLVKIVCCPPTVLLGWAQSS